MRFRGGEFSTGTKGNFQSELTVFTQCNIAALRSRLATISIRQGQGGGGASSSSEAG
jgi:hypothetical protein